MNEAELRKLFKIPDPVTAAEFARRTGKTESAVRHMIDRRQLPMVTEREIIGVSGEHLGSTRRLLILWNEWEEMVFEATNQRTSERHEWRKQWIKKAESLASDLGVASLNACAS